MYFNFGTLSDTKSGPTKENTLRVRESVTFAARFKDPLSLDPEGGPKKNLGYC